MLPSCLRNKKKISFLFCASIRTRNGILGGKYRAVLWIRSDGRRLCRVLRENEEWKELYPPPFFFFRAT